MSYYLQIGSGLIDLMDPQPDQIDVAAIEDRLWTMRRFSYDARALVIRQHTHMVKRLVALWGGFDGLMDWAERHDDHEGVITDIPGPLKNLIATRTSLLIEIEERLDIAISIAKNRGYPSAAVRREVHYFDKLAETVEWRFILGNDVKPWSVPLPVWLPEDHAIELAHEAQALTRAA